MKIIKVKKKRDVSASSRHSIDKENMDVMSTGSRYEQLAA